MAKAFDTIPAKVTITNVAVPQKAYDAGSIQLAKAEDVYSDANGKYVMTSAERQVQLYRVNQFVTLESEEVLTLVAETSEEVAYYASLANDEITVVIEAVESATVEGD